MISSKDLGFGLSSLSAISSIYAGKAQSYSLKAQQQQAEFQADQAISQAKLNNMKLQQNYNKTQESQAVIFASQGRSFSSGSIQNLMQRDKENLRWDIDYMEKSGQAQYHAAKAGAIGYGGAAKVAEIGGYSKGLMTISQSAIDYGKIK